MAKPNNLQNLKSEKTGLDFLLEKLEGCYKPSTPEKKALLHRFGFPTKYLRSFDLIIIKTRTFDEIKTPKDVMFLEVKVTAKYLPNFPEGFFFGMTHNEEELLKNHEEVFKLCLVSISEKHRTYRLLTFKELENLIKIKRVQYQINL